MPRSETQAILTPVIIDPSGNYDKEPRKREKQASTGASAATIRALSARMAAFYFRAPIKAFFRTRVDYMGYARAINPRVQAGEPWSWRMTSPFILASAVQQHGWKFIPNQFLPPLLANTTIGAVLYTSYLHTLGALHEPSSLASKRTDPLPPFSATFTAGLAAGALQSLLAAPLDALQVRFQSAELMQGKYRDMWHYAYRKTQTIGLRGIFAGWTLSLIRDSLGAATFFSVFEYVKGQLFYEFVSSFYGRWERLNPYQKETLVAQKGDGQRSAVEPHYLMEPMFILMAGIAASVSQAVIHFPLSRIQDVHYGRLEWIDAHSKLNPNQGPAHTLRMYASAYRKTFKQCLVRARREGGVRRWLYRGFIIGTLSQTPSTAAGLIVFEIVRRKYSDSTDTVKIQKDGYDILLV